jgi:hypothetical protein
MDEIVQDVVVGRLEKIYGEVSERRGVIIDSHVRSFIASLVLESLEVRGNEWEARTKLDPNKSWASEEIASQVDKAVHSVTDETSAYKGTDGTQHIPLIGVVEQIHKRWCGIFPFCR